ncbi:hypothetical protein PVAP13_8NG210400 [Panicum virgatum]|uniref:Uncharacterized protein n=1 Tax=Panicum virgatum TaxID=38727 RepID=A0A8T0PCK7_PANVG|nr:hypothetical protein PVAP13_8NG210400 [Panicum virgatum]
MVNLVNPEFYTCSIGRDKDSYVIGNPDWQYAANKFVKQLPDDVIVHLRDPPIKAHFLSLSSPK